MLHPASDHWMSVARMGLNVFGRMCLYLLVVCLSVSRKHPEMRMSYYKLKKRKRKRLKKGG